MSNLSFRDLIKECIVILSTTSIFIGKSHILYGNILKISNCSIENLNGIALSHLDPTFISRIQFQIHKIKKRKERQRERGNRHLSAPLDRVPPLGARPPFFACAPPDLCTHTGDTFSSP